MSSTSATGRRTYDICYRAEYVFDVQEAILVTQYLRLDRALYTCEVPGIDAVRGGKTTLVKALIRAGATYYSDEFAVLDKKGCVHPYPVPLSIRENVSRPGTKTPVEALGGQAGVEPLPVGLVVVTRYQPRARWRPQTLSPAQAMLALMDNTVAARRDPQYTMPVLKQVVINAQIIHSVRGEAKRIVPVLLRYLD